MIQADYLDHIMGNATCTDAIRGGVDQALALAATPEGRATLSTTFDLCDPGVLEDTTTAQLFVRQLAFSIAASVNTATPNTVAEACTAQASALAGGGSPLEGLDAWLAVGDAKATSAGCLQIESAGWARQLVENGQEAAYTYLTCSQGMPLSVFLPSNGTAGTITPAFNVTSADIEAQCKAAFGPALPPLQPSELSLNFMEKLAEVGQVVFTNGALDGWSAGSLTADIPGVAMATVVYPDAAHASDLDEIDGLIPGDTESPELRAQAINDAGVWLEASRAAALGGGAAGVPGSAPAPEAPSSSGMEHRWRAALLAAVLTVCCFTF